MKQLDNLYFKTAKQLFEDEQITIVSLQKYVENGLISQSQLNEITGGI